ncbi:hypothetical protein ACS0TY_023387 [Phlomoides rotata]
MKIRTLKFDVMDSAVTNFNGVTTAKPSLMTRLNIEISVKNTNFRRYNYRNAIVVFKYRGTVVGSAVVRRLRVNWRSMKKLVEVDLHLVNP